ncbi:hypothetical protein SUGI_0824470 [Cryptomeria japonica]|uniref:ubiquitin carboxyl-terminal hydrolase 17 n=1 Tax=Cryptomeria japonica TaxID=3369 RepID=UPI002414721C|nr:ubiquitin carboxyl-terminal hydrolase 17 [Cryptomeria japonica]GLJ40195.1 hypothetical protein SUGI_0824470 [Cryptomeria japonica]
MPRSRELRISDYLVVLVLVPLVSLVIFRRWKKNWAAKKAEIRKLLVLAAEEAARAEEEAAQLYTSTFVTRYQCALCFSPSTTRCSRCKAVRYCSGKCQIVHWRQGHKYECQPPDIDDSNASLPHVSTQGREIDLNSISEPQFFKSIDANVQGLSTSSKASDQSNESISEFSPSKRFEDSASKIGPVIANEKPDPNYAIPKVLDFSVKSSVNSATHNASLGDALVPDDPITDVPTQKLSVSNTSTSTPANNVLSSKVFASDIPVSKDERNELPGSGIALDNGLGSSSFERKIHNSTSCTENLCVSMDEPDLPVARNNPPISEEPVHDNITFKAAKHSSSASAHVVNPSRSFNSASSNNDRMVDSSRSLNQSPSTSKNVMDDLTGKRSMKNISNFGNLVTSSSGQKDSTSLNSRSSFNSMSRTDVHMGDASSPCNQSSSTCKKVVDSQTRKSPINNTSNSGESVTSSPVQKNSVPLASSSKSSLQTNDDSSSSTSSVFVDSTSKVMNTKIATSKVENQRASEISGTSKRSVRSGFQQSSPLKERAPVCSISRQKNGSHDIISSNTFHTVVSSLPTGNALKASVKKVAQQLKSSKALKQSSTKIINESSGKSNQTLFPYESFVKLFNWDKLELPPCGLINCGNSCYANVVLQCLIFTRPVAGYLLQGSHSKNCQRRERNDWCFMCELQQLASRMRDGKGPISPFRILSQIQNIGNHLGYGKEEDAHEFLRFAIDAMQSVCLAEADGGRAVDPLLQDTTLIQQTFGGYLQSKIKCLKCQYISERYDRMMDLNVEIEGNIESLQDALAQFTAPEILDGDNKYKCDRCKSYVKARKQLTVHEAPNILTIALKRFQSGKFGKLNKRVIFPEILNMKPYMSGTGDRPPTYKLYAVVVHLDMMNASFSGHYVCYVKNLQGAWYKINDCKVKQVELDRVLSQGAYMLLYSRSSPRPPAIMRNGILPPSMPANAVHCEHAVKTPVMQNGLERISVLGTSPATSCTVNLEDYGFDYNGAPSFKGGRIKGSRDYADWASSDSGSLFSCSDEASWSTESNRDSTSTDDYGETIFGDSGRLTCTSSGLPEDPSMLHSSFFCTKSSPPLQTEYYFQNNASFQDSVFSNQHFFDDIYHQNRETDPEISTSPFTTPRDTDGLPAWLNNSASSFFFSPSVPLGHVETSSDSEPSSLKSYWLDSRSNKNNHAGFSQFQNSVGAPGASESGALMSEDFSGTVKSKHIKEKSMPEFLQEPARLNFDVLSRSFNATTNFDYCLVHDTRTSDSLTD